MFVEKSRGYPQKDWENVPISNETFLCFILRAGIYVPVKVRSLWPSVVWFKLNSDISSRVPLICSISITQSQISFSEYYVNTHISDLHLVTEVPHTLAFRWVVDTGIMGSLTKKMNKKPGDWFPSCTAEAWQ